MPRDPKSYRKNPMKCYGRLTRHWIQLARGELLFDSWKFLGWRLLSGKSQAELGRLLSPHYESRSEVLIYNYENYLHRPSRKNLEKVAKLMGVHVRDLLSTPEEFEANKLLHQERKLAIKTAN